MINISHLRYFSDAVRLKSLTLAARHHRVTTSAISRAISQLEALFGISLIKHQRRGFEATEAGLRLAAESSNIFSALESLADRLQPANGPLHGNLRIGTSLSLAKALISETLVTMHTEHPSLKIQLKLGPTASLKSYLDNDEVDCIITIDDGRLESFSQVEIHQGKFIGVCRKGSRNGAKEFILTGPRPETDALASSYKKKSGRPLPVAMEVESWELICQLSSQNLGIGFVPDIMLETQSPWRKVLQQHPLGFATLDYTIAAFFHARRTPKHSATKFLEALGAR